MEEDTSEEDEHKIVSKQRVPAENSKKSLLLRVGKKIVITGVLISSAPFVLPPLIVASGIGFAFSVPFGLVFASYACTEKVMSVLLPCTPSVEERGGSGDFGVEEEELVEDEGIYQREEKVVETAAGLERTDDTEVDDKVEDDPRIVKIEDVIEEIQEVDGVGEEKMGDRKMDGRVEGAAALERTDGTEVEEDPRMVEIEDAIEEMQDKMVEAQEVDGVGEEKTDDTVVDDTVAAGAALERTDDTEVDDKVEEDPRIVEIKDVMEERKIGEVEEEKPNIEGRGADESGGDVFGKGAATSEIKHGSAEPEVSPAKEEHSSSMMGEEKVGEVKAEAQPAAPAFKMEKISSSSKEVPYNEQKIWELINSMRTVVGYKAAIQPSFSEELKALYIFTGVDPPVAFNDPLDLVEISDKLRLLMTIVGVK